METSQKNVSIKIGDKFFTDKSGILQNGTLIGNLLPKNYYIEIEKDGYQVWQKNIEVKPALVSKITGVILVPNKTEKQLLPLPGKLSNFYFNGREELIFQNENGFYYNQKDAPVKLRGDKFISWNGDGNAFITKDSVKNVYYFYKSGDLSKFFNVTAAFNNLKKDAIREIVFHPADSDKLIVKAKNGLYILDIIRLKLETASEDDLIAWTVQNPNIYYLKALKPENAGTPENYGIYSFNLILKNESLIYKFKTDDNFQPQADLKIYSDNGKTMIIKEDNDVLVIDVPSGKLERIGIPADSAVFSPDKQKIVFAAAGKKIIVYFLTDAVEELGKNKGDSITLDFYSQNSSKIKNVDWYKDSNHLLVEYSDAQGQSRIDFTEIDSRSPINRYELAQGEKMSYNPQSNSLYFVQKNSLYFLDLTSF